MAGESAEEQFTYRDGGLPGDEIVSTMVRQLPSVLVPGGRAQMLGNWEIIRDSEDPSQPHPWDERVRAWVEEAGAEAWIIQRETLSPESYAETWLKDASENRDRKHYEQTYLAYLNDFESRNVHSIGFGMIWLRRPSEATAAGVTEPLQRFEEITYPIQQPIAHALTESVRRYDRLAAMDDEARRAPQRHSAARRIGSVPHPAALHRDRGLCVGERWRARRGPDCGGPSDAAVLARIRRGGSRRTRYATAASARYPAARGARTSTQELPAL